MGTTDKLRALYAEVMGHPPVHTDTHFDMIDDIQGHIRWEITDSTNEIEDLTAKVKQFQLTIMELTDTILTYEEMIRSQCARRAEATTLEQQAQVVIAQFMGEHNAENH